MTNCLRTKLGGLVAGVALVVAVLHPPPAAGVYSDAVVLDALQRGATWLLYQQNVDGSWGTTAAEQMLYTSDAVRALRAMNIFGPQYVSGVVWLANHRTTNSDFAARRLLALTPYRATLTSERAALEAAKVGTAPGITLVGWGLTGRYRADPLDTALATLALGSSDPFSFLVNLAAFDGLASSMVASTWTIGQPDAVLPFRGDLPTTIAVATAIRACLTGAGLTRCRELVDNTLPAVETVLANYTYSNSLERGLIAGYFAVFRDTAPPPIPLVQIGSMINGLLSSQQGDNSWDGDVLTTTTALQALARWLCLERAGAATPVTISSAALRDAVNRSLDHHAMDVVTRGDLWRLTALDLAYASTAGSLADLAEAGNLTALDVSGNACVLSMPNAAATLQGWFPNAVITMHPVGDINRDNATNAYDLYLLVAHLLETDTFGFGSAELRAADLNFDGHVDSRDLYWLDRLLLKQDVSQLCS